jgi:hypothetical protein
MYCVYTLLPHWRHIQPTLQLHPFSTPWGVFSLQHGVNHRGLWAHSSVITVVALLVTQRHRRICTTPPCHGWDSNSYDIQDIHFIFMPVRLRDCKVQLILIFVHEKCCLIWIFYYIRNMSINDIFLLEEWWSGTRALPNNVSFQSNMSSPMISWTWCTEGRYLIWMQKQVLFNENMIYEEYFR